MKTDNSFGGGAAWIQKNGLIPSMFLYTTVAMILTGFAGGISNIIDGMITSRVLGEDA